MLARPIPFTTRVPDTGTKRYLVRLKRLATLLILSLALFARTQAQNEIYTRAMEGAIAKASYRSRPEDLQQAASQFERLSTTQPKEWLPNYWAAYTYSLLSFKETNAAKKDALLDKADAFHQKAAEQQPNNDELYVLQAQLGINRITVDPQTRGLQYGPAIQSALETARQLNPNNPRLYCLEGQSLFYTPEQYGGGKKVACSLLQQASEKMATFKAASPIHPNWGGETITYLLRQCGGQ